MNLQVPASNDARMASGSIGCSPQRHHPGSFLLGGSWMVFKWGYKSPNMGYNYSYLTYNRTYSYP